MSGVTPYFHKCTTPPPPQPPYFRGYLEPVIPITGEFGAHFLYVSSKDHPTHPQPAPQPLPRQTPNAHSSSPRVTRGPTHVKAVLSAARGFPASASHPIPTCHPGEVKTCHGNSQVFHFFFQVVSPKFPDF